MLGGAAQSPEPDLCTSQQNPYRPECTEPETGCTGYCERGRWDRRRQKKMKDNSMLEHPESKSNFQQQNLLAFIVTAHKLGQSHLNILIQ